jgi:23S rRNA pseudouridine2605 synthase
MSRRPPPAVHRQRPARPAARTEKVATRHGLARVLSKRGVCSRSDAARMVCAGRVALDGRPVLDPEFPVAVDHPGISIDGQLLGCRERICLMLNKPRGLVTTVRDERGRDTVYRCFDGAALPWLAPIGRLDKASEGLLLFSNDPQWAAQITDPQRGPSKTYHVQIDCVPEPDWLPRLLDGVEVEGEHLCASAVSLLRAGQRNAWLEIVLDEGRNRQIRRLLAAFDIGVLRLLRVAIGELQLGDLGKGSWRHLSAAEVRALAAG